MAVATRSLASVPQRRRKHALSGYFGLDGRPAANFAAPAARRACQLCALAAAGTTVLGAFARAFVSIAPLEKASSGFPLLSRGAAAAARPRSRAVAAAAAAKKRPRRTSARKGGFAPIAAIDAAPTSYDTEAKVLKIVKYPHPALRRQNADVKVFDDKLRQLADNLFSTMYFCDNGIGLAAPQVGVNVRLMVYNPLRSPDSEHREGDEVYVNPKIVRVSDAKDRLGEACLSFPEVSGDVDRHIWIEVEALDLEGKPFSRRIEGMEARLFQHEYDHLEGVVFIDHLNSRDKDDAQADLQRLKELYIKAGGKEPAV